MNSMASINSSKSRMDDGSSRGTGRQKGLGSDFSTSLGMQRDSLGGQDKNSIRIWNLNEVAQRDEVRESNLLIFGDKGCGKRSLMQAINKHVVRASNKLIEVDKMGSHFAALDSEFLYVKDLTEKDALNTIVTSDESLPKLNVWMLQDIEKVDLLPLVLRAEDLEYTCAIIMLDFD